MSVFRRRPTNVQPPIQPQYQITQAQLRRLQELRELQKECDNLRDYLAAALETSGSIEPGNLQANLVISMQRTPTWNILRVQLGNEAVNLLRSRIPPRPCRTIRITSAYREYE